MFLINKTMSQHIGWWLVEMVIWYLIFYIILFAIKNPVNIGWISFFLVILGSLAVFTSPLTRHISLWNKILDKVMKKEEENMKY